MTMSHTARRTAVLLALTTTLTLPAASAQDTTLSCHPVGGVILTQLLGPTTGLYVVSGDFAGSARGLILSQTHSANVTQAVLSHIFVLADGAALTTARGAATFTSLDQRRALAQVQFNITGGSGPYQGASGHLTAMGAVNFASGQIVMRYQGSVCGGMK